ncbi:toxin-antitoxin system YwqK family antitoxin [Aquimarina sp. I32.4]|uniref:toxin-antitoxin system YwqK family antitoxin n=1 Tax=Aquimarina sp. I32.4 TaxID=2053903 RepID=UPI000CDEBA2B|nr:hypothetical protein [Aquimarina sp. I32.4]
MKNYLTISLFLILSSVYGQEKEVIPPKPIPLTFTHLLILDNDIEGKIKYFRKSDNYNLNGQYKVYETKLNTNTDIVNSYYNTGYKFIGKFHKGYKDGFWKTTYKNKLVKTENWNKGFIIGKYRVYDIKGNLLYQTNFGAKGNGKFKDFYYVTGILKQEGNYENGKKQDKWCEYDKEGKLTKTVIYKDGIEVKDER